MKLSENKVNDCEKELDKMKDYFDLSLYELSASKLHKLKLEYNTICQLNNEEINWFNKKCTNDLNIQLELNDDFVSNPKLQTSTPRYKNDSFKCIREAIEKFDKSVATFHESSTQTDIIIEECTGNVEIFINKVEIDNYDEEKVAEVVKFDDLTKTSRLTPNVYKSIDSGISGDITISEQRSMTEDEIENKSEVSDNDEHHIDEITENEEENIMRESQHIKKRQSLANETLFMRNEIVPNCSVSENQIYKALFLKKLLRFLLSFLLVCAILITVIYPLIKPTCNNGRKEYFLKFIYMDEENVNNAPTAY